MRPTNFQKISRIHNFKIPEDFYRFLHSDPVYLRTSYFSVLADIYRAVMLAPEIIVILFTRGLPCVQYTRNLLTCENNIADYKIFQEYQLNSRRFPVFPGAISNSSSSRSCRQPVHSCCKLQGLGRAVEYSGGCGASTFVKVTFAVHFCNCIRQMVAPIPHLAERQRNLICSEE